MAGRGVRRVHRGGRARCGSRCRATARPHRWARQPPWRTRCCRASAATGCDYSVPQVATVVTVAGPARRGAARRRGGRRHPARRPGAPGRDRPRIARGDLPAPAVRRSLRPAAPRLAARRRDDSGVAMVAGLLDVGLAAAVRSASDRAPFGTSFVDELRALVGIGSAIGATGVLIALAAPWMGLWAIPVFCVAAAADPVLVPSVRDDPRHLPADHPVAVAGHRGRSATPRPATRGGSASWPSRSGASSGCPNATCSTSSTPP